MRQAGSKNTQIQRQAQRQIHITTNTGTTDRPKYDVICFWKGDDKMSVIMQNM